MSGIHCIADQSSQNLWKVGLGTGNLKAPSVDSNVSLGRELLTKGKDRLEKQERAKKGRP